MLRVLYLFLLKEHKKQISEALNNLEKVDQAHKQEVVKVREETLQQSRNLTLHKT